MTLRESQEVFSISEIFFQKILHELAAGLGLLDVDEVVTGQEDNFAIAHLLCVGVEDVLAGVIVVRGIEAPAGADVELGDVGGDEAGPGVL